MAQNLALKISEQIKRHYLTVLDIALNFLKILSKKLIDIQLS